jgi:hypothetical protein
MVIYATNNTYYAVIVRLRDCPAIGVACGGPWERARRAATGATIASFNFDFLYPTFQFLALLLLAHQLLPKSTASCCRNEEPMLRLLQGGGREGPQALRALPGRGLLRARRAHLPAARADESRARTASASTGPRTRRSVMTRRAGGTSTKAGASQELAESAHIFTGCGSGSQQGRLDA